MSNSLTNSLAALAMAALSAMPAAAQKFECPEGVGYDFAYANPTTGGATGGGWDLSIKRARGASAAGLPELSVRRETMRCTYRLPHGAFALLARAFPDGAECTVRQDDYFELAYFLCE